MSEAETKGRGPPVAYVDRPPQLKGTTAEWSQQGSFIEQIGGARTGPRRRLGAMASCWAGCDFRPAPPGGSI